MSMFADGQLTLGNIFASVGALGTASYGLVDATKAFNGGVSNVGFGYIESAVAGYLPALRLASSDQPLATIKANWLNGVAKADQKAIVKSLIRLGITTATAYKLAEAAPGIDQAAFVAIAQKIDSGGALSEEEVNILGRFDAILDAQMDAGFERADQLYRNASKLLAALISVILAVAAVFVYDGSHVHDDLGVAVLVGLVATPLAPIAKDLSSALGTAVNALKSVRG